MTTAMQSVCESATDKISKPVEIVEECEKAGSEVVPRTCTCECGGTKVIETPKPLEEPLCSDKNCAASSDSGAPESTHTEKERSGCSEVNSVTGSPEVPDIPSYLKTLPQPVAGKLYHAQLHQRGQALLERLGATSPVPLGPICKPGRAPPPATAPSDAADAGESTAASTPRKDAAAWLTAGALEKTPSAAPIEQPEEMKKVEAKMMSGVKASANKIC